MAKKIDLTGKIFNKLTVIKQSAVINKKIFYLCKCECGKECNIVGASLKNGNTKSCGCIKSARDKVFSKTHGMSRTRTYIIWCGMINRCCNTNDQVYYRYGGRGITICDRWRNSFIDFIYDMGEAPEKHTIERIDNNEGYSKDNCKWATYTEQAKNTRRTRLIEFNGITMCIGDWAKSIGINEATLRCRFDRFNWPIEKALTTPAKFKKYHNR